MSIDYDKPATVYWTAGGILKGATCSGSRGFPKLREAIVFAVERLRPLEPLSVNVLTPNMRIEGFDEIEKHYRALTQDNKGAP